MMGGYGIIKDTGAPPTTRLLCNFGVGFSAKTLTSSLGLTIADLAKGRINSLEKVNAMSLAPDRTTVWVKWALLLSALKNKNTTKCLAVSVAAASAADTVSSTLALILHEESPLVVMVIWTFLKLGISFLF